ncbi:amidohydrolase family protein [Sphingobium sp. EM0848]|uniref:amidohydrolase family protein n=1 Tax=Sphingobium sp. EM0848 TaxID=2743473 RepID=UPI001C3FDF0F|nr:amidohydrolase family protein [Sphingobium sp. EM0848]
MNAIGGAVLHRCGMADYPVRVGTPVTRLPWTTIDLHCHLAVPAVEALVANHPDRTARAVAEAEAMGAASLAVNAAMMADLMPRLTDVSVRLADMDAMGVDIQAISPSPTQYHYWAEKDLARTVVGRINDGIAALCADHPDRFVGLGTVALQHPSLAAQQLESAMRDHDFKGVEISSLAGGRDIADRFFDPFWQKADELGAVVFIHPWGTTLGTRLADHYLMNTIGQPFETTVCLSKLIFGGTLDRHPGVKIIAAHGGGYLPAYAGRSDHAHAVRPEAQGCSCRPTDILRRIWFDSLVYDPRQLRRLIEEVGIDRVVLGSDYPFDMGDYDPAGLLADLAEEDQRRILGENARTLLNL